MRVLVTGGTGFTGKALVKRLLDLKHDVVALDYKEGLRTQELREWGAKVVLGSVTDRDVVAHAMQGVEVVHHLAAAFREMGVSDTYYYEVNVNGTRNVLDVARAAGVRKFVYCSTCGVHGNVDPAPGGEDAPIRPADYYQRTKYEAEPFVVRAAKEGFPATILRPAAIYGPGDPERFFLIYRRVATGSFPIFGKGKTLYHPLYIDNLVDAFLAVMDPAKGQGEAYLIADEHYVEIERLVKLIGEAMGVPVRTPHYPVMPLVIAGHVFEKICRPFGIVPPIFPRRVDWYRQNRAFKIDKAKRELGWAPRVGLEEGLRRTAEWYRAEGLL
ncbi:MAG TPA: NAD-dependent epimerase/dehydratase family protein [Candidatus Polarisedimenticolaceae bacterium]|nr:NAD-dependent epimerase/dehydratase family protein [Candidatus Polarisedimenticolaceae bacterium]